MIDWYFDYQGEGAGDNNLRECDIGMYYYLTTVTFDTKELHEMIPEEARTTLSSWLIVYCYHSNANAVMLIIAVIMRCQAVTIMGK